ncbi:amino acid transporter, putative [Plasmodium malariae]|uniref:Amino acid transporter, putative n=1 Tax=Plasmodium malariae TaxID=5858 RepID=A0A1A8X1S2_PLAMA|nr:amino acid transporter, putative [Plasmodium malariae]
MEKQNKKDQLNINKYNKSIDIKDDRENQRLKLLKIFKSYHIKYEGHTNLDTLCDYAIYFQDADILNVLLKKQNCDNLFYYLVTIGIPYNDIIEMASVFENMKYLKNCNLYMLPWIYKKLNEFHKFDVRIILLILYTLSIIKCIDLICLHITYVSYYFMESTPWVYKNLDIKICSKFNGSKNICDSSRNICYYNDRTQTCEMNRMKLGIKIYDTLLSKYVEPKNTNKILSVLLNHEIWIVCMIHCTVNMSLHSGMYFYSSKGLRLDVNVIPITYLIVLCCFLVDMLLFVTFTTIIGEHLKNIDKNYYILKKKEKKDHSSTIQDVKAILSTCIYPWNALLHEHAYPSHSKHMLTSHGMHR